MSDHYFGTIQEANGERHQVTLVEKRNTYVVIDSSRAFFKSNGLQVVAEFGKAGRLLLNSVKEFGNG